MKNKRSFYIALLLLLGVALTIGYAVLSQTLKIKGNTSIASNSWIIYFDHLVERPGTLEATVPAQINTAKDRIDFTITLDKPGDNYTFETDIVNDGTIDAMIDSVSLSGLPASLNGIVEWKVNYLDGTELRKCDELLHNTKRRIRVVVNYKKDIDALPEATDMELSLEVKYVQLDNSVCTTTNPAGEDPIDPLDGRHTLTINPNYGKYNGSDAIITKRMATGEVYVFGEDPVHEVHTFDGWNVDKDGTYNTTSHLITMGNEDINAIAEWTWDIVDEENNLGYCYSVEGNYYTNFDDALESITDEGTIKVLANSCEITKSYVFNNKVITIDLNGHVLGASFTGTLFTTNSDFTFADTSDKGSGTFNSTYSGNSTSNIIVSQFSDLKILGGTYNIDSNFVNFYGGVFELKNANVNVDNSTNNTGVGQIFTIQPEHYTITSVIKDSDFTFNGVGQDFFYIYNNFEFENVNFDVTTSSSFRVIEQWNTDSDVGEYVGGKYKNLSIVASGFVNGIWSGEAISYLNDVDIDIDCLGAGDLYGIYFPGTSYLDHVDVDIKVTNGANVVYGVYVFGPEASNVNVNIDVPFGGKVYALEFHGTNASEATVSDSTVVVNSGANDIVGVYGGGATLNNVDVTINAPSIGSSRFGYNYSNGVINGGKLILKGTTFHNPVRYYALNISDTFSVSNYEIESDYSCVTYNGSSGLTLDKVNMVCGEYGVVGSNVTQTDTNIDSGL